MTNFYTPPTLTGYNQAPPVNDGTQVAQNLVNWDTHTGKIGDPLKDFSESINSQLVSTFEDITSIAANIAELTSLTPGVSPSGSIFVQGYFNINDGGGGIFYWDAASTETEDLTLIFEAGAGGTGRWIRIVNQFLTQIMAGVVDDTTDQSTQLNAFFAAGKPFFITPGIFVANSAVNVPFGAIIEAAPGAVIDFSAATELGNFPDAVAFKIGGGSFTSISGLGSNATRGDFELTFASDPDTTQGDVLVAYNATNGSFQGSDGGNHAGEFFQVAIDNGTTQVVNGPIFDSYATGDVGMFKMNGGSVNITGGLKIIGPDAAGLSTVRAWRGLHLIDSYIDIQSESKSDKASNLKYCFKVWGTQVGIQTRNNSADEYGLSISNCQHIYLDGYWYGDKHGVTTGGDTNIGSVPNRDIQLNGFFACSVNGASAFLHHGNAEFCKIEGTFHGGITTAGDNQIFRGSVYAKNNGVCIQGSELLGLNHDFDGMQCYSDGDPNLSSRGVIDMGGNTAATSIHTTRGGKLRLSNLSITAPSANGVLVKIVNRGAIWTQNAQIDLRGLTITEDSGALSAGIQVANNAGDGGDDWNVVNLHGIDLGVNDPGYSTMNVTHIRGWSDSGTVDILTDTGASSVVDTITFNKEAPIAPSVGLILNDVSFSGDKFVTEISARTTTTATVGTLTIDGSNFGANTTLTGIYTAMVNT